ncbi:MAG TPA: 50S ribosomal protein L24 [Candidatus Binatia bacterium]|jgi:large subunit ribosomal protein L24|nr:50S ribosomal protein L24 [Candidatus Binatia bacterium]
MAVKLKIKKGDTVLVVAGRERGKSGKVTRVAPDHGHVFVERLNVVKRHQKPRGPQAGGGGIVEKEAPIPISNVMYLCNKCNEPVRIGKKQLEDGRRLRVCRGCGEQIES